MKFPASAKKCFFCLCLLMMFTIGCASKGAVKTTEEETIRISEESEKKNQEKASAQAVLEYIKISDEKGFYRVIIATITPPNYAVFKLSKPDRIIIDLPETLIGKNQELLEVGNELITSIKNTQLQDKEKNFLRIEIGLKHDVAYNTKTENNTIVLDIQNKGTTDTQKTQHKKENSSKEITKNVSEKKGICVINDVKVDQTPTANKITIVTDSEIEKYNSYSLQNPSRLVIDIPGAKSMIMQPKVDTNSPLFEKIRIGQNNNDVRIVVDFKKEKLPIYQIAQEEKLLNVIFNGEEATVLDKRKEEQEKSTKATATAKESQDGQKQGEASTSGKTEGKIYSGERISFDFKDADIKNVLRLIADISGLNIIVGEKVTGKITLKLENIAWDEALDIILENNSLGKIETKNITRIDTSEQIKKINEERLMAKKSQELVEETIVKTIDISYAQASELAAFVKAMNVLTPNRGSVTPFQLTNKLTVHDIPSVVEKVESIIKIQDIPTRQVMIEARVIQSSPNYTKELGIRWGGQYKGHQGGGSADGGADIPITGGLTNNSVVDLLTAANGAIGFGYIKDKYDLEMKITALENEDKLKILSNPKILSLDNKESNIKQGVALPYLKLNEQGVSTTEFKEAVLEMKVKPKITAANTIALNVEVKKDQKSAQTGVNNEPGIDVREIKTDLLVESGKTVVIGGIYENTKSKNIKKVPFFGSIPYLGYFFKSVSESDQLTELLVFLTVTVVESPGAVAKENNENQG